MSIAADRVPLPNRRETLTEALDWEGTLWTLSVGFDPSGAVREIFIDGARGGSALQVLAHDVAIVASRALQRGDRAGEIAASLNAASLATGESTPSLLHKALATAARIERERAEGAAA